MCKKNITFDIVHIHESYYEAYQGPSCVKYGNFILPKELILKQYFLMFKIRKKIAVSVWLLQYGSKLYLALNVNAI